MHSRIFQISSNRITEDDRISESRYEDYFVPSVADYVVASEDEVDDMKWLAQATKGLKVNPEKRTVQLISKKEYFEDKFNKFQEAVEKLKDTSLDEFITTKLDFKMYDLKSAYEEKYEFYFDDNYEHLGNVPLDEWVRNTKEGELFFIGSTFDYHF